TERPSTLDLGMVTLPLDDLRVLDLTTWWAGPAATHVLAALGADVIHVESIRRPDGVRMTGAMVAAPDSPWWEYSNLFLSQNTNKRGVTLALRDPPDVALFE